MIAVRRLPPPVITLVVIVVATLVSNRADSADRWHWPLVGAVSREFERPMHEWSAGHRGIDIVARTGATVRAPVAGRVSFAGSVARRGVVVISTPYDDDVTLEPVEPAVQRGDVVEQGDIVGVLQPGHDGGVALHFGVRVHGAYVDPDMFLPPTPTVVVYDSRLVSW